MTLKEKFNNLVPKEFGGMQEPLLGDCQEIADDYAIEFAEWLLKKFIIALETGIDAEADNSKELLEIFKKEKGW